MYRFGIIGCGQISKRHAENITKVGELIAVCDIVSSKATELAEKYNATAYTAIDELLKNEKEIDIISICTPNGVHAEHCIKSLEHGKNVLCEKPLSISTKTAGEIISAAELNKKKVFVVKQNRYNEPVQIVKKMLDKNKLGEVLSFEINCFWNRPQAYYESNWKGTKQMDGGILYTQFSHFIDLLYWLLGDVASVNGFKKKSSIRKLLQIEDCGVAILKLNSGAVGTLNYTINSYKKNLEGSFAIFGEKGSVKIGGQYLNTLEWFELDEAKPVLTQSAPPNKYGFYQGSMSNHHKVYEELIASLNGDGNLLEAKDAVKTIEIIEKIYAASEEV